MRRIIIIIVIMMEIKMIELQINTTIMIIMMIIINWLCFTFLSTISGILQLRN